MTQQKQQLKAAAHHLKPIIIVGARGITDSLIEETNQALKAHELIKIKVKGLEKDDRKTAASQICEQLSAELVQLIGHIIVIYRKNPDK